MDMPSWQFRLLKVYFRAKRSFSPPASQVNIAKERKELEDLSKSFKPLGRIACTPVSAGGAPAEWILPAGVAAGRVLLYLHGGSYIAGSINSHRALAANLAAAAGGRALLLDYRLAPEHPFPAALDDALAAYRWLLAEGAPAREISVAGDSAGGGLALALLLALRDAGDPLPAAAALLSALTDMTFSGETIQSKAKADLILDFEKERQFAPLYLGNTSPRDPRVSPLYADLRGLPRLLIQVGSDEILLADSIRLAEKAKAAGVNVTLEVWEGMQHVWHFAASIIPEGRKAIRAIGEFIKAR
jgi:acetyl esterase/lipase